MNKSVVSFLALCACSEPPPPELTPREHFTITRELLPTNNTQAREYALDLNGDKTVDNQLGMVLSTLQVGWDFEFQAPSDLAFAQHAIVVPIEVSGTDDESLMGVAFGTSEALIIPSDRVPPISDAGVIDVGVAFLGPMELELQHARVRINEHTADRLTGTIAGALTYGDVYEKLLLAWVGVVEAMVAKDCTALESPPLCGCPTKDNGGGYWLDHMDANHDCSITLDEAKNNEIVQSLLSPDLGKNNEYLLSFGIGFEAVSVP